MYIISLFLLPPFIVGARASQTFGGPVARHLLANIFASHPVVVAAATDADLWMPKSRVVTATPFALCPYLDPALG
jgi:hypothetical protein